VSSSSGNVNEDGEDAAILQPVTMIAYEPEPGTIAASCDGTSSEKGGGCNDGFSCCRAEVGEFQ